MSRELPTGMPVPFVRYTGAPEPKARPPVDEGALVVCTDVSIRHGEIPLAAIAYVAAAPLGKGWRVVDGMISSTQGEEAALHLAMRECEKLAIELVEFRTDSAGLVSAIDRRKRSSTDLRRKLDRNPGWRIVRVHRSHVKAAHKLARDALRGW